MNSWKRGESGLEDPGSPALAVARRQWWVIALTTVLAVGVTAVGLSLMQPTYEGTATLQAPITTGLQSPTDLTYVDRLMNTYTKLAQQPSFRADVAHGLGRTTAPTLTITVEPNTDLLQLAASDPSPALAQRAANVAAGVLVTRAGGLATAGSQAGENVLSSQLDSLSNALTSLKLKLVETPARAEQRRSTLQEAISGDQASYDALAQQRAQLQLADATRNQALAIVQSASLPTSPASPKWAPVLALALALGLLGGLGLAFLRERFVPRLYTVEAIESAAEAVVLAAIPDVTRKVANSDHFNGGSPVQEAFAVLAAHVLAEASARPLHTILVTSRNQGDGKSTVAANLAAELARSDRQVVLVDGDMRSPSVHHIFEVDSTPGLSNMLQSSELTFDLEELIQHPDGLPNLGVIPAGPRPVGPARLLASERLMGLLYGLLESADFVVFDAPPLVVSDPLSIAGLADEVLLVVGGEAVPDRDLHAATRELSGIGVNHVSVVVNRWRGREADYSYAYGSLAS